MDIINHAVQGGLMGYTFALWKRLNVYVWIGIGLSLGAFNDILGWLEKVWTGNPDAWNWYNYIHKEAWYAWIIPPIGLHTLMDSFTHGYWFTWYEGWGWVFTIFNWLITILAAIILFHWHYALMDRGEI